MESTVNQVLVIESKILNRTLLVYNQIFLELYPLLKSKKIKVGKGIAKVLLRGYLQSQFRIRDLDKYMKDLFESAKAIVNFEEVVLCFDDLERRDKDKFNLVNLIGFINTLVEDSNVKVLIIANDGEIKEDDYKDVKEKTIGSEIHFRGNLLEVYDEIIQERFERKGSKVYSDFLLKRKDLIVGLFEQANEVNLRNLIFGLGFFEYIFYELKKENSPAFEDSELWKERLNSLLGFTLAVALEYRGKQLSSTDENGKSIRELGKGILDVPFIREYFEDEITKETEFPPKNYAQVFQRKYRSKNWIFYSYPAVFDFVTGVSALKFDSLKDELNNAIKGNDGILPQYL